MTLIRVKVKGSQHDSLIKIIGQVWTFRPYEEGFFATGECGEDMLEKIVDTCRSNPNLETEVYFDNEDDKIQSYAYIKEGSLCEWQEAEYESYDVETLYNMSDDDLEELGVIDRWYLNNIYHDGEVTLVKKGLENFGLFKKINFN